MLLANWNWKKAIAGTLSGVALLTVAGGLVSCTPEVEEEEEVEEGYVAPEREEEEREEDD